MAEDDTDEAVVEEEEVDACLACKLGFHRECQQFWDSLTGIALIDWCCCGGADVWRGETAAVGVKIGSTPKTPVDSYFEGFTGTKALTDYADPISTGRKEAARKFPIAVGMTCEWAWLKNAGGGAIPIVGCTGYPATAIHHGPDKNTLRNVEGNVHRICANCHNRWHGVNDPLYPAERPPADEPFLPTDGNWKEHDPKTKATDEEVFAEELRRRNESRKHGNLE